MAQVSSGPSCVWRCCIYKDSPSPSWGARIQSMLGKCHPVFCLIILWPKFLVSSCNSHLLAFIMSTALRFHKYQSILAHVDFLFICIYINKALVVIIMSNIFYLLWIFHQGSSNLFKKRHAKNSSCCSSSGIYDQSQASEFLFICTLHVIEGPEHAC